MAGVLCNDVFAALWICESIGIEILLIPQWKFTCFLKNTNKNTQTRFKVCSNLSSVLQQLTFVLLTTFINLEHLSRPTIRVTIQIWKGKCWLEVRRELLLKIMQRCKHTRITAPVWLIRISYCDFITHKF